MKKLTTPQIEALRSVFSGNPCGRQDVLARIHDAGYVDIIDDKWVVTNLGRKTLDQIDAA